MTKATPMMEQYRAAKEAHPEAVIFFRMGDFYEVFGDDAVTVAEALDITLTARSAGEEGKVPMCGVPHHAVDGYLAKLIEKGFRVAICEQMEDPKTAKGLVKRDVIRIVSPGTVLESTILPDNSHNYLAALCYTKEGWGFCYTDISTGEFKVTEFPKDNDDGKEKIFDELYRVRPKEILLPTKLYNDDAFRRKLKKVFDGLVTEVPAEDFNLKNSAAVLSEQFRVEEADSLFLPDLAIMAAGAVLSFLNRTQKRFLSYISKAQHYTANTYMVLDQSTRKNLELNETIFTGKRKGSLLWVMDKTLCVMGKRLIGDWLNNPLLDIDEILLRQNAVKELYENPLALDEIRGFLSD
ncbi:MAG: DNA mismatch repair protein MutS, partial [Bacillota bacterium]|nr:DNA mismatch repair protein MutS [Bacillota bacterium]